MSNNPNVNPIVCDSANVITTAEKRIIGIQVVPSGATWEVVLKDSNAVTKFRLNEKCYPLFLCKPLFVTGLTCSTLTNITEVLIYTDEV